MSTCLHISKGGINCDNKKILGTNFCYLKSHHTNQKEYQNCVETLYQNFISQTIDSKDFQVSDVIGDGACLYRCFTIHLLKNLNLLEKRNNEIYTKFMEVTNFFLKLRLGKNDFKISDISSVEYQAQIDDIVEQKMVESNYMFINELAKYLQFKIKDWLVANSNLQIEELGGFTLEHLIENCHDITLEQYNALYGIFAGDLDYIIIQNDESKNASKNESNDENNDDVSTNVEESNDEIQYDESLSEISVGEVVKSGKGASKKNYKKINIPDRWGSTSEIYGFSGLCGVNVNVYVIKRFDRKNCSIILGKKVVKSSRIELYQRVGLRSFDDKMEKDLDILLIEKKGFSHYQYLNKHT
jgi:hypothetical protein